MRSITHLQLSKLCYFYLEEGLNSVYNEANYSNIVFLWLVCLDGSILMKPGARSRPKRRENSYPSLGQLSRPYIWYISKTSFFNWIRRFILIR